MNKILLVEDQKEFQLIVEKILRDGQHHIHFANSAKEAKQMLITERYDLVLLDLSLPDENGLDLYCEMQKNPQVSDIPVIFLTGSESISAKVTAFSLGAEDFISKNFDPVEFKARVYSKVRKNKNNAKLSPEQILGPFLFNLPAQKVYFTDSRTEISLTSKEFKLLFLLAKNPEVILNREKILSEIWGDGTFVNDRSVDTCVYQLRKKLTAAGDHIVSVPGEGYRFENIIKKAA